MTEAKEIRENEGVAEQSQRELTGRVGTTLTPRSESNGKRSIWRLGKRRAQRAES